MSFAVRDGKFDVAVVAGPRAGPWPTAGARAISAICAEMGLTVGVLGGENLVARGAIPLPGTGALVLAEDPQRRIHRIRARALVRISAPATLPDPFPGWRSPGVLPLATATQLLQTGRVRWAPATIILGTGNRAFRFGSRLLDAGVPEVSCVESFAQWGAKRFAGWEVERRRFETAGGKVLEARVVSLAEKAPQLWELRLEDARGIRLLEAARVVAAGPFRDLPGLREHPPGSLLFELEQTAGITREDDVEGWVLEEERGRWLAGKIVRALVDDVGERRDELDRVHRRARARLKRASRHREEPFTPAYQGKWIGGADARAIRSFPGVPRQAQKARPVASVECFENIACNLCEKACPESAIRFSKERDEILVEADCTACGQCLPACPSGATLMIHERENLSTSYVTLPWRGRRRWAQGELATLVNRRGEALGSGRVTAVGESEGAPVQQVTVEVPTHLIWEGRGLRRQKPDAGTAEDFATDLERDADSLVEVTLDGEKRLVRDRIPLSVALYDIGYGRDGDALLCRDGSCGLCQVLVDGVKKAACQTRVHRGMAIRVGARARGSADGSICPCLGVSSAEVAERTRQGRLRSPEAVIAVTHLGEGRCHGSVCSDPLRRLLGDLGVDASQWIDWRFPWQEWVLTPASRD
jgi:ferredoxin